jgi:hypothetical protein
LHSNHLYRVIYRIDRQTIRQLIRHTIRQKISVFDGEFSSLTCVTRKLNGALSAQAILTVFIFWALCNRFCILNFSTNTQHLLVGVSGTPLFPRCFPSCFPLLAYRGCASVFQRTGLSVPSKTQPGSRWGISDWLVVSQRPSSAEQNSCIRFPVRTSFRAG